MYKRQHLYIALCVCVCVCTRACVFIMEIRITVPVISFTLSSNEEYYFLTTLIVVLLYNNKIFQHECLSDLKEIATIFIISR